MVRFWLLSAAFFGLLGVSIGAFGAHSLKHALDEYGKSVWEKAVFYQMIHAVALLTVGLLQFLFRQISFSLAGWGFFAGILLFSGSLYALALTGTKGLGAITPFGGVSFLLGWGWLIFTIIKLRF